METFQFFYKNRRFLGFGLACTLASNFGQTFFIALFGDHIRTTFNLGHAEFGGVYSSATLISAVIILWAGRLIDRVDLRLYTALIFIGLALSAGTMAFAQTLMGLGAALVGLRLFGQGLLRHTAVVSQARYFSKTRGRAMSLVSLGFPIAEATFPALLLMVLAFMNWREAWGWMSVYILLFHLPLVLWLLKGHGERHKALEEKLAREGQTDTLSSRTIATDWRFQMIVPASLMGPFMMTGLFFHQLAIAEAKGWSFELIAASFPAFAAATVISSLATGNLVDRFGPGRILPFFVWPQVAALMVLASTSHPLSVPLYLALGGLTTGASTVLLSASWAETFGVRHLGKIRSLTSSLAVMSTAVSPLWAGWLLDNGWAVESIAIGAAMITTSTGLLVMIPARALRKSRLP
ncbi:MAG: MFS transporter [Rhodospirillaceae bacterium]|nr:MAG: MFS transporter [Rhodospirillaceae bacterium]